MTSVTIIGCGWFGFPLAKSLIKQGYSVKANKRLPQDLNQLFQVGIDAYQFDLAAENTLNAARELLNTDMLIINIPPGLRRGETDYLANLHVLTSAIGDKQYQRIIFVSTTGVYPNEDKLMTENDAQPHSLVSETLLQAESMFASMNNSCIVRFAGLIGPQRHPGRFFAGKSDVSGGNVAVNLVHLDDCIAATSLILRAPEVAKVYNLCAPEHPAKADFYPYAATHLGEIAPQFNQQTAPSKIIDGNLICRQLGFSYHHTNPIKMLDAC